MKVTGLHLHELGYLTSNQLLPCSAPPTSIYLEILRRALSLFLTVQFSFEQISKLGRTAKDGLDDFDVATATEL